jgi:hypothetical protein
MTAEERAQAAIEAHGEADDAWLAYTMRDDWMPTDKRPRPELWEFLASAIRAAEDEVLERVAREIEAWGEPAGPNDSEGSKAIRFAVQRIHSFKTGSGK